MPKATKEQFILISEIQRVRENNNKLWMDLVRIAMEMDPVRTKKTLYQITQNDQEVMYLMEKMVNA